MTGLTADQWRAMDLRPGDTVCPTHGRIVPAEGLVPHCAEPVAGRPCSRIALRAADDRGRTVYVWPQPTSCPAGHPLGGGTMSVTWVGCRCTPAGGHRLWLCVACPRGAEPPMWPPPCPLYLEAAVTRPR